MEKNCPQCGAKNDFNNDVCDQCGATLPSAPGAGRSEAACGLGTKD